MNKYTNINNLESYIELLPDLVYIKDIKGIFLHCNTNYLNFFKRDKEDIIGKTDFELFPALDVKRITENDNKVINEKNTISFNHTIIKENDILYFNTIKQPLYDENNEIMGIFCIAKNITIEKQYEIINEDHSKLIEHIAVEKDLKKTLNTIVNLAELRNHSTLCSILLFDENNQTLHCGAAPSLPMFYNDAIEGIEIGNKIGSCGSAAYNQKRVIIDNIDTHENWDNYLELTTKANLHSSWSQPIFSSSNKLLGTFAMYSKEHKSPSSFELKLIESYAHITSIAIEKDTQQQRVLDQNNYISTLFDNTLSGLMHVSGDRKLIKANKKNAEIFGYKTAKEMIGISMLDLHLSPENYTHFGEKNFNKLIYGEKLNIEYQLRKKDGSIIWCELSGKTFDTSTPADLDKGVLWTINDITHKKQLEIELHQKNEELQLFKQIIENIKAGIILTDAKSKIIYVNSAFEKNTLYSQEEVIGKDCNFLQKDDVNQNAVNIIKSSLLNETKCQVELRNYKKDGEIFHNLLSISPLYNSDNKLSYFVGLQNDITNEKKKEAILFEQSKLAAMGEMIGNIAHQWRQPLSIISTGTATLEVSKELDVLTDKEFKETCHLINDTVQYLSKTIDDFRAFLKDEKEEVHFNLEDNINSFLHLIEGTANNNQINIIQDTKDDINSIGYPNKLIQCFLNIFNNSKDAFADTEEKYIFISSYINDDYILISFKDNAGGISKNALNKLFEPYFTTKHKSQGTGLGLHMTYNLIVKEMKGSIEAHNVSYEYNDNKYTGAEVIISLPYK